MAPKITYQEGRKEVEGLEIQWRIPMTDDLGGNGKPAMFLTGIGAGWGDEEPMNPVTPRVPTRFETTITDRAAGRRYQFVIEVDDEGPAIIGFTMDTAEGFEPVRSAAELAGIPFGRFLNESLAAVAREVEEPYLRWRTGSITRQDIEAVRRPRRTVDEERLARVAKLYQAASAAGESTGKRVATELDVSDSNARRLIMLARQRGFLPPTGEEA